ncbi:hypothetical protein BDV95DRAFT_560576 [Massariosphaeria phaeospora]|uniref:Uncharacterized protein n=1 Tax=Massariosphaeria phaeospora TaxID=100035 RepID=A0A7C8ICQ2_9PLEO|nr:hypothetical protein BDV95DRAFT_560576 [Massariosphaeria phaeospora]
MMQSQLGGISDAAMIPESGGSSDSQMASGMRSAAAVEATALTSKLQVGGISDAVFPSGGSSVSKKTSGVSAGVEVTSSTTLRSLEEGSQRLPPRFPMSPSQSGGGDRGRRGGRGRGRGNNVTAAIRNTLGSGRLLDSAQPVTPVGQTRAHTAQHPRVRQVEIYTYGFGVIDEEERELREAEAGGEI